MRGIARGTMVLHDVPFEKVTHLLWTTVKAHGVRNLYHALASNFLDFFIAISSVSASVGYRA